jgi:predicted transcriptional regulator
MAPLQKQPRQVGPETPRIMAIANELSSEIAAALLANKNSPQDLVKLKQVLLEIHSTLQKMAEDAHPSRLHAASMNSVPPSKNRQH